MSININEYEAVVAERDALRRQVDALRREAGRIVAEQSRNITKALRKQLADKDKEVERLKSENDELRWEVEQWKATSRENKLIAEQMAKPYERELSASQAREQRLRDALTVCVCAMQDYQAGIGITEMFDKGERLGRLALQSEKQDTTALQSPRWKTSRLGSIA